MKKRLLAVLLACCMAASMASDRPARRGGTGRPRPARAAWGSNTRPGGGRARRADPCAGTRPVADG